MEKRVTIKSIAQEVGVSPSVVSSCLNKPEGTTARMSEQTAQKIIEAAQRLGYRRNIHASALRTRKSGNIAIMGGFHPKHNWVYQGSNMNMFIGINRAIREHGKYSLVLSMEQLSRDEGYRSLREGMVDGVVVLEHCDKELLKRFQKYSIPYVTCNVRPNAKRSIYPDDTAHITHVLDDWCTKGVDTLCFMQARFLSGHFSTLERVAKVEKEARRHGMKFVKIMYPRRTKLSVLCEEVWRYESPGVISYSANVAQNLIIYDLYRKKSSSSIPVLTWVNQSDGKKLVEPIEKILIPFEDMGYIAAKGLLMELSGEECYEGERMECRYLSTKIESEGMEAME